MNTSSHHLFTSVYPLLPSPVWSDPPLPSPIWSEPPLPSILSGSSGSHHASNDSKHCGSVSSWDYLHMYSPEPLSSTDSKHCGSVSSWDYLHMYSPEPLSSTDSKHCGSVSSWDDLHMYSPKPLSSTDSKRYDSSSSFEEVSDHEYSSKQSNQSDSSSSFEEVSFFVAARYNPNTEEIEYFARFKEGPDGWVQDARSAKRAAIIFWEQQNIRNITNCKRIRFGKRNIKLTKT
eukprot:967962_1